MRKDLDQVVVNESRSTEAANEVGLEYLPLARRQWSPHSLDETQSPGRRDNNLLNYSGKKT